MVDSSRWLFSLLLTEHFQNEKLHVEHVHKQCKFTCVPLCECKEKKVTQGRKDVVAF